MKDKLFCDMLIDIIFTNSSVSPSQLEVGSHYLARSKGKEGCFFEDCFGRTVFGGLFLGGELFWMGTVFEVMYLSSGFASDHHGHKAKGSSFIILSYLDMSSFVEGR